MSRIAHLVSTLLVLSVAAVPRPGIVRFENHAAVDDAGPFNALGASLFSALWQFEHDRGWLDDQLTLLADHDFDYVRVLGIVGPKFWSDRTVDPRAPGYDARVAAFTDHVYDRFGLRVEWSIFGGVDTTPTPESRRALVDRFAAALRDRRHKVFAIEVGNELWQNGIPDIAELRALGSRLRERLPGVGVALTSPPPEPSETSGICEMYAGWPGIATMHYDRDVGKADGRLRPVRQPWGWPAVYDRGCPGRLPAAVINDEPIGPQSSVEEDADARRIALAYVMTFAGGNAAYTLHAAPGIRGGGVEDRQRGRAATFAALPNGMQILAALKAARGYTPPGLANWTRHAADAASSPLTGFDRAVAADTLAGAYVTTSGEQVFAVLLGIRKSVTATSKRAMTLEIVEPATGKVIETIRRAAGDPFTIAHTGDGIVLRGRAGGRADSGRPLQLTALQNWR